MISLEHRIQNYCRFSSTSDSAVAFQIENRDHTEIPVQSAIKGFIY